MTTAPQPAKPGTGTIYSIFAKDGDSWRHYGNCKAASADGAIKAAATAAGTYVAIPSRSFQPVTVTLEQKTVVTLAK